MSDFPFLRVLLDLVRVGVICFAALVALGFFRVLALALLPAPAVVFAAVSVGAALALPRRWVGAAGVIGTSAGIVVVRVALPRRLSGVSVGVSGVICEVAIAGAAVAVGANWSLAATGIIAWWCTFIGLARPLPPRLPMGT